MGKHSYVAQLERARLLEIESYLKGKAEEGRVDAGISETIGLDEARGADFQHPLQGRGEGKKPYRRKSGLDWLLAKGRLSPEQMDAGLQYGDDWRTANDVSVKSCLMDIRGGGDETTPQQIRLSASRRIDQARDRALSGHKYMIALCDRVAGDGQRLRDIAGGDDEKAQKFEAVLLVALDLLAVHYGISTR